MTSSTIPFDNLADYEDKDYDYFLIFILFLIAWCFFLHI